MHPAIDLRNSWPELPPYHAQSVPVAGTKRPGQTAHYRNAIWGLIDINSPGAPKALDQVFEAGLSHGRDRPCLGTRPVVSTNPLKYADHYLWQTYGEVDIRKRHIGSALASMFKNGVGGGDFDTVGIWSQNRSEWQIIDLALQSYNKICVSLYDTLGKDSVEYIINHAHLTIIFTTADHIPNLLKLAPRVPAVKVIVSIDPLSLRIKSIFSEWASSLNIEIKELSDLEAYGKANPLEPVPAKPEAIASICYTSGTTGNPKGVLFTHANLALSVYSNMFGDVFPDDLCLVSYLPLAHIYERMCELVTLARGGKVGYFTGDPLRLLEDVQILKPHWFPSVPRVLNRLYQATMAGGNVPGLKGMLFRKALQVKRDQLLSTGKNTHLFWDSLVFRKVQAALGGNVVVMTSASAPIRKEIMDFFKIAFGCEVFEGMYGMTEGCGVCTRTWPGDHTSAGTVGAPHPVSEVKLVDVPEMGYTSEDKPFPRGELCMRGAHCFSAYYKDEEKTKEAIDREGWVHTGDIATLDECGRFKIVDRVKNIMKLAQGEYVALEKIENLYSASSPMIAQIYVHGDPLQPYLLAVIVLDPVSFSPVVSKIMGNAVALEDMKAACADGRVVQHVLDMITEFARVNGLAGFEMVKRIHLSVDPFTMEDGTLTPTLKIKRRDAYLKYKTELDGLYALGEPRGRL